MVRQSLVKNSLMACTIYFLLVLAWKALSGGFRQFPRAKTVGQKTETVIQIEAGILSLFVVLTRFWYRHWAPLMHITWSISLASAAGLSSLVWGPPMPFIGVLFVAITLFFTRITKWALQSRVYGYKFGPSVQA